VIVAKVKLKSVSPYTQSRYHNTPKEPKEGFDAYEQRTWRERCHTDKNGMLFMPPMVLKNCLSECAKYLSMQIPGKGKSTYTKHFEAGVLVMDPVPLNIHKDKVRPLTLFVPADGKRGSGKRVMKTFPTVDEWEGTATFYIFDETITEDVFRKHLEEAGKFIGVGSFRPRNNSFHGRFEVVNVKWEKAA
jgi:hypothetical protein